ncbi:MAG: hypothetical protein ACYCQK_09970, partial [Acidiferrobacteraceae bacterium]
GHWEVTTLIYGLLGIAVGTFQRDGSPWYPLLQGRIGYWAGRLAGWPLPIPWLVILKGLSILVFIGGTAVILGSWILLWLKIAERFLGRPGSSTRLAYALIPLAAAGMLLGSALLLLNLLALPRTDLPWLGIARAMLLAAGLLWSGALSARVIWRLNGVTGWRSVLACASILAGGSAVTAAWLLQF